MTDSARSIPAYTVEVILVCNNQHRHRQTVLYHPDTDSLDLPDWPNCPFGGCGADWSRVERSRNG